MNKVKQFIIDYKDDISYLINERRLYNKEQINSFIIDLLINHFTIDATSEEILLAMEDYTVVQLFTGDSNGKIH